jgi:hypothetical protein
MFVSISNLQIWFIDLHQLIVPVLNIEKHKKFFSFLLMHQNEKFQAIIFKTKKKKMFKKVSLVEISQNVTTSFIITCNL